jgi:hypothetical protein
MEHVNDNSREGGQEGLVLQILIPACRTIDQPGTGYAWLNGYCVLSCRLRAHDVVLDGDVRIGEHLGENSDLITSLAHALDPTAVLAGMDLTSVVSRLGRLPIDATDPAPPLALLTKLRTMIEQHRPIDLAITPESRNAVLVEAEARNLGGGLNGISYTVGGSFGAGLDSGNPRLLAQVLADEASACLLAMSRITLTDLQRVKLEAAWKRWRESLAPHLPEKEVQPIFEP